MAELVLETQGLTKEFRGRGSTVHALAGVDLAVEAGTVLGLLGHNGSGKTTLVRILSTLTRATSGTALVAGHDVARAPERARAAIAVTAQETTLDRRLSGRENLVVLARLRGLGRRQACRQADELLDAYLLADAARRPVGTWSGGMRRRLDIAASLVGAPRLLCLDEPTTGLDPESRTEIWRIVRELAAAGTTVLLTTQYLEEADRLSDRVAVLQRGTVLVDDTPRSLKARIGHRLSLRTDAAVEVVRAIVEPLGVSSLVEDVPTDPSAAVDPLAPTSQRRLSGLLGTHRPTLAGLLTALSDGGVEVTDIAVEEPTLDEAYLTLVGRPSPPKGGTP